MSSALHCKKFGHVDGHRLPYELKITLSRKLWDTDGSCGFGEATMTTDDTPYLEGLRDAGVDGAQELIDILNEHESVILWHEY